MAKSLGQTIYVPIGNAEFSGKIKLKDLELSNQQFYDSIFTEEYDVEYTLILLDDKLETYFVDILAIK